MLARHSQLQNPTARANTPAPVSVVWHNGHAISVRQDGSCCALVNGRLEEFRYVFEAEEFFHLWDSGNQDRAIPFVCPTASLVVYGSLLFRAPEWVQQAGHDQEIGKNQYVWFFHYAAETGTQWIVTETYDQAMIELRYLIDAESSPSWDENALPF
jgi:hypothetical protein